MLNVQSNTSCLSMPVHDISTTGFDERGVRKIEAADSSLFVDRFREMLALSEEAYNEPRYRQTTQQGTYNYYKASVDPDVKWRSDLDERMIELAGSGDVLKWFEQRTGLSRLYLEVMQVNYMHPGEVTSMHHHDHHRHAFSAVMLLEEAAQGGHFVIGTDSRQALQEANHIPLAVGDLVMFKSGVAHGVTPIEAGMRRTWVWAFSQYDR